MKTTINKSAFINWYNQSESYKDNFTYEGLVALFDYLEQYEEETGSELDFDPIAFACDWNEYESLEEFNKEYPEAYESIEDLEDFTTIIRIPGSEGFICQVF